jgi:hypothetical protein
MPSASQTFAAMKASYNARFVVHVAHLPRMIRRREIPARATA